MSGLIFRDEEERTENSRRDHFESPENHIKKKGKKKVFLLAVDISVFFLPFFFFVLSASNNYASASNVRWQWFGGCSIDSCALHTQKQSINEEAFEKRFHLDFKKKRSLSL